MAQFGSALDWGSRGRGFKSRQPDLLMAFITDGATSRWNHAVRLAPATVYDFRGQSHVRHRAPFAGIPDESRRRVDNSLKEEYTQ